MSKNKQTKKSSKKTGTLVSFLAQSIPHKAEQLRLYRGRISYLDIL